MARPRSSEKRSAIIEGAIRVIAAQGLGAPTAMIAKEAGVSSGALFTYFHTKADLFNQVYIELKRQMAEVTTIEFSTEPTERAQLERVWGGWVKWALTHQQERRALSHLSVSDDVTSETRQIASAPYAEIESMLDRIRRQGTMQDAPLTFVAAVVLSLVDSTIEYIRQEPTESDRLITIGFGVLWRAIS